MKKKKEEPVRMKRAYRRKKPIDSFVEEQPLPESKPVPVKVDNPEKEVLRCECGQEVLPKNHQCYKCSHRN